MGTWGCGIFEDDLSSDIKGIFGASVAEGISIEKITKSILKQYSDVLEDEDEGPIVYLSLAALQLEHGEVQDSIKRKALQIIEIGEGLERWEESGEEELNGRLEALDKLKEELQKI